MPEINGVSDAHAAAVARQAREGWAATQAELDMAHDVAADAADAADAAQRITRPEVAAATINAISAPVSGQPLLATNRHVAELENAQRRVTAIVESFYLGIGRKWLPLFFLEPADDDIRRMVDKAVEAYDLRFSNWIEGVGEHKFRAGDVVIIASSRPYERWNCHDFGPDNYGNMPHYVGSTAECVEHVTSEDVYCDLDIYIRTEIGSCKKRHIENLSLIAKCDGVGKDGKPNAMRRKYLKEHFFSVPFARGNMIVMVRICDLCWNGFLLKNSIQTNTTGIVEPYVDGFGSVGSGTITKSEYLWSHKVIDKTIDNLKITLERDPTLPELEKSLSTEKFIGAKN
jgi:hypothetical protein